MSTSSQPPSEDQEPSSEEPDRLIKRYANRKLYDTSRSCYVTLEDVAEMIRKGEDVRVIDNRSQDDLTAVTLAQIIFEQQKSTRRAMPLPALRAIIERPAELFQKLSAPVTQLRGEAARQVDKLKQKRTETIDEGRQVIIDAIENMQAAIDETQQKVDDRVKAAVDALTHVPDLQRDVEQLSDRLDRLERLGVRLADAMGLGPRLAGADSAEDGTEDETGEVIEFGNQPPDAAANDA